MKDAHEQLHVQKVMELQIDPNTGEMAYKEKTEIVEAVVCKVEKNRRGKKEFS